MSGEVRSVRGYLSVQTVHLRIHSIEDDVVSLSDGQHLAVLEVCATNFALQGESEQEALISGYSAFLNSLTFPIQTLIRVLQLDLWGYLSELERRIREGDVHDELVDLAYDHLHFLRKLAQSRTLLERRFYVVVSSYTETRQRRSPLSRLLPNFVAQSREAATVEDREAARKQLTVRSEEVERGLARCGLRARRLKTPELAQLLYACWCPEHSRVQRLERDLAEYTSLVVSADRRNGPNGRAQLSREKTGHLDFEQMDSGDETRPSPDERHFLLGTRSVADLLAPASVEVARDHIRLDHEYARVLVVTGYPRTVSLSWLSPLIDFEQPIEISQFVYPLESAQVVQALTHKMVQLQSSRLMADRGGKLADPEREVAYEDAERLRDALQRGDEKVFSVSLYLLVRASTISALDSLTRRVETAIDSMLAQSRVAILEQDRGFRSCLPYGKDELGVYRNLDTSSLATTFPFSSSTLSMERGVLYGISTHNHSPVLFDPFDPSLENANLVIFAKSGAGKSYFTKLIAMRSLIYGVDFLVIDPEDEYRSLCSAVDGQYIRLASSSAQHLNPFDLPAQHSLSASASGLSQQTVDEDERDPLAEQVASLLGLLELMLAEPSQPLTNDERSLLDSALYQTYARAGITRVPSTHSRPAPLLRDLHSVLSDDKRDLAQSLATRLHRYVEGSLSGLFSGPTNVALSKPFVVFNVQSLEPELRPLGIHLIASFVWNQVRRSLRPRLLVVDEAWTLMQYPEGGAFLAGLSRRARKHFLGLVTITQDVSDFLDSEQGRTVLTNASQKLLMKQDSSTIEPVVRAFQLSSEDRQYLLGAGKGEGLFFAKGSHVALKVEASPLERRLATTAPRELASLDDVGSEVGPRSRRGDGSARHFDPRHTMTELFEEEEQ